MSSYEEHLWLCFLHDYLNTCANIDTLAAHIVIHKSFRQLIYIWYVLLVREIDESRMMKYILLGGRIADIVRTIFPQKHVLLRKLLTWSFFAIGLRTVSKQLDTHLQRLLNIWQTNNVHGYEYSQAMLRVYKGVYPTKIGVPDIRLDFGITSEAVYFENGITTSKVIELILGYKPENGNDEVTIMNVENHMKENNTGHHCEWNVNVEPRFKFELTTGMICSLLNLQNAAENDIESATENSSCSSCSSDDFYTISSASSYSNSNSSSTDSDFEEIECKETPALIVAKYNLNRCIEATCCSDVHDNDIDKDSYSNSNTNSHSNSNGELESESEYSSTSNSTVHNVSSSNTIHTGHIKGYKRKQCNSPIFVDTISIESRSSSPTVYIVSSSPSSLSAASLVTPFTSPVNHLSSSSEVRNFYNIIDSTSSDISQVTTSSTVNDSMPSNSQNSYAMKSRGKDMKTIMAVYAKTSPSIHFTDDESGGKQPYNESDNYVDVDFDDYDDDDVNNDDDDDKNDNDYEENKAKRARFGSPPKTGGKDMKVLRRYLYDEPDTETD